MKNKKLHIWIAVVAVILFAALAVFGAGQDIKGIRDMRFGIDIRGGVEAVFDRSIHTAFTVVMCAFIIFAFAAVYHMESIEYFSLPLLAGLISGCYSSVCIAGPLWVWWEGFKKKVKKGE